MDLEIRDTPSSGRGVFAPRDLEAGEVLFVEYPAAVAGLDAAPTDLPMTSTASARISPAKLREVVRIARATDVSPSLAILVSQLLVLDAPPPGAPASSLELGGRIPAGESAQPRKPGAADVAALRGAEKQADAWAAAVARFGARVIPVLHGAATDAGGEDGAAATPQRVVQLAAVVNGNAIAVRGPDGGVHGVGLFPAVAMLNHACAPNCCYVRHPTLPAVCLRVTRRVPAGTELLNAYTDTHAPRDRIAASFLADRGFRCACFVCTDPAARGHPPLAATALRTGAGWTPLRPDGGDGRLAAGRATVAADVPAALAARLETAVDAARAHAEAAAAAAAAAKDAGSAGHDAAAIAAAGAAAAARATARAIAVLSCPPPPPDAPTSAEEGSGGGGGGPAAAGVDGSPPVRLGWEHWAVQRARVLGCAWGEAGAAWDVVRELAPVAVRAMDRLSVARCGTASQSLERLSLLLQAHRAAARGGAATPAEVERAAHAVVECARVCLPKGDPATMSAVQALVLARKALRA